jgi:hypothetical protein
MAELHAASAGQPGTGTPRDELHKTLEMLVELAQSLVEQTARLRTAAGAAGEPHNRLIATLTGELDRVRQRCDAIARELAAREASDVPAAATPPADQPPAHADSAEALALELKLAGASGAEVQRTLEETFGHDDAARIVDRVFRFRPRS